jgi:hypothetical protein
MRRIKIAPYEPILWENTKKKKMDQYSTGGILIGINIGKNWGEIPKLRDG